MKPWSVPDFYRGLMESLMKNNFIMLIAFSALLSLVSGAVYATDKNGEHSKIEQALRYYENGNCADSLPLVREMAGNGDVSAQWVFGKFFLDGRCVDRDYLAAKHWFEKSAESGSSVAMYHLANLYYQGLGVDRNIDMAEKYWDQSALMGNPVAQYNLGFLYATPEHGKLDYKKAVQYLAASSSQGYSDAMFQLGLLFWNGQGVAKDERIALKLWNDAASRGNKMAIDLLNRQDEKGSGKVKGDGGNKK